MPTSAIKNPTGWLPYGATDDSIILQHPLTSDPSSYFATKGTHLLQGTGHVYDLVKGFCPMGTGGHRLTNITGYLDLDNAGQLTYEVERDFICLDSVYGSDGYLPAANEYCLSSTPTIGNAHEFGRKNATSMVWVGCNLNGYAPSIYIHSAGKSDFVCVNIGWSGGRVGGTVWIAFDGILVAYGARNAATLSGMLANFYIGGDRGIAGRFMAQHYMRNLQISTRPPMFAVHPLLRHVGMISDSMLNSDDVINGNYKDVVSSWTIRRELAKRGHYCGTITVTTDGGARLDNSIDGGTTDYIYTQLTTLLAQNPTVVIIRGGTNDAQGSRCTQASWQASVNAYVTACMAVPSVRRVFLLGIPSAVGSTAGNSAAVQAERAAGDIKLQAVANAWRAANPTDTRDVIFVNDIYSALGGENPPAGTFIGQVAGTYADLHLSGYGHYVHGKTIANWLIRELGTA